MKTVVTLIFIALFNGVVFSQLENQDKIVAAYGQEWFDLMQTESQEVLVLLDKYAEHGFFVKKVSPGKYEEFTPITSVPLRSKDNLTISIAQFMQEYESENFNELRYNYFPQQDFQVYKLDGVDAIIYILPQNIVLSK